MSGPARAPILLCGWVALVLSFAAAVLGQPADAERELRDRVAALASAKESGDAGAVVAESRKLCALLLQLIAQVDLARELQEPAAEAFEEALRIEPDPMTAYALGTLLLRNGERAEARDVFDRLLASSGGAAEVHLLVGNAYSSTPFLDEAVREFEAAAQRRPDLFRAHLNLGYAHLRLNAGQDNPETRRALTAALALDRSSFEANFYLGQLESLAKRYDEAAGYLRAAAAARPESADPWLQLGLNAFAGGDPEAETLLRKGVDLATEHRTDVKLLPRAYGTLSRIAASRDDLEAGERLFALSRELEKPPAYDPPAEKDSASGADDARRAALAARRRELVETLATVYNDWGTAAARDGDPQEALRRYHDAERWNPDAPLLMKNVGLAALETGDYEESVRALTAAAAADPQDKSVPSLLAVALSSAGRWAESARVFDGLGEALYDRPRMAFMWAVALARSDETERAREVLARLRELPLPPPALVQLSGLYEELGDHDTARELRREAEPQSP